MTSGKLCTFQHDFPEERKSGCVSQTALLPALSSYAAGEDEMEYGFAEHGKALFEAVLDSKVNQMRNKSIREILAELPPEALTLG